MDRLRENRVVVAMRAKAKETGRAVVCYPFRGDDGYLRFEQAGRVLVRPDGQVFTMTQRVRVGDTVGNVVDMVPFRRDYPSQVKVRVAGPNGTVWVDAGVLVAE